MKENNNAERLSDAIGEVNDRYVAEASKAPVKRPTSRRVMIIAIAAVLIVSVIFGILALNRSQTPYIPGDVTILLPEQLSSNIVSGTAVKYTGSMYSSVAGAPPAFEFQYYGLCVAAKAISELPDIYESLPDYGYLNTESYRIFLMEVVDPLKSGMGGRFYYALPSNLKGDLTVYDTLLISMNQRSDGYILKNTSTNTLFAFNGLFDDYEPELGNIIAFSDGIFDESLWQDRSWLFGYQFAKFYLDMPQDDPYNPLIVGRGSTYEMAKAKLFEKMGDREPKSLTVFEPQAEEARLALEYVEPFKNGVFSTFGNSYSNQIVYRRYIGGCPTNETVRIDKETENVTYSSFKFTEEDMVSLPDIGAYIDALDLSTLTPQHIDPADKELCFNSALGWYEKTENGVYSIVRVAWQYMNSGIDPELELMLSYSYYDETFILLDASGARVVSREELIELIGENQNIHYGEYGEKQEIPM